MLFVQGTRQVRTLLQLRSRISLVGGKLSQAAPYKIVEDMLQKFWSRFWTPEKYTHTGNLNTKTHSLLSTPQGRADRKHSAGQGTLVNRNIRKEKHTSQLYTQSNRLAAVDSQVQKHQRRAWVNTSVCGPHAPQGQHDALGMIRQESYNTNAPEEEDGKKHNTKQNKKTTQLVVYKPWIAMSPVRVAAHGCPTLTCTSCWHWPSPM